MADKSIGELTEATTVTSTDQFVLEQSNVAKRLTGQTLINYLLKAIDGHGGMTSIVKTGTSGLKDTYRITWADETTFDFVVTNGAKGDKGDNSYIWLKFSANKPTQDSDMYDTPDDWLGVNVGNNTTAPTSYTAYTWVHIKGDKGDTGEAAQKLSDSIVYQTSDSGTVVPDGSWSSTIPYVSPGYYLWTRTTISFNSGTPTTWYSVSRFGIDGTGAVATVNGYSPDANGNVELTAANVGARPDTWTPTAADVGAIADGSGTVLTDNIASAAVTTDKLASTAVTRAKLASDVKTLVFINKTVATSAWVSSTTYDDYPYRAAVACSGVTANHFASVVFSPGDSTDGNYATVATTYSGGVYLYAASIPDSTLTIPTILCQPTA